MLGLTLTRRWRQDIDALTAQIAQLRRQRDEAREERDTYRTAVRTTSRLYTEATSRRAVSLVKRERLVEGGRNTPVGSRVVAARERARADALERRLAMLQAVNERCTCGGAS